MKKKAKKTSGKITAFYVRVSSGSQNIESQLPDLERYAETLDVTPVWFVDKKTGKTMNRPQWNKLQDAIDNNKVARLVVWRLDRLGRTVSGLTKLFDELQAKKIHFESLKDKIDLSTTAGRLIANVLASVAAYETEVRAERVQAGQSIAKSKGKSWGGSTKGRLHKITIEQVRQIVKMKDERQKVSVICRTVNVDRPSVYRVLQRVEDGDIAL